MVRARVVNGRIVVDEPTFLPDGTVLDLVLDDGGDDLDEETRKRLDQALSQAWEEAKAGNVRPSAEVIQSLRLRK